MFWLAKVWHQSYALNHDVETWLDLRRKCCNVISQRNVTLPKATFSINATTVGEFSLECKCPLSSGVAMKSEHTGELHRMHEKPHLKQQNLICQIQTLCSEEL